MDNSLGQPAMGNRISRKKFFRSSGMAIAAGGLLTCQLKGAVTGTLIAASEGAHFSKSFTGILDSAGNMSFPHGLGPTLPANVLSVNAFVKLPDGKVRNVSVESIDETYISVAAGLPNAEVKVGVVYAKNSASW